MKLLKVFIIIILINSCSFDNKTGIWNSNDNLSKKESGVFTEFKTLAINKDNFNEVINLKQEFTFEIPAKINNYKWEDINYNQFNNYDNFSYNKSKNLIYKSKKISRHRLQNSFLYENKNLILTDNKGNIIIYSIEIDEVITKYNFYKKKHKKVDKILNIVLNNSIVYISDNLGYVFAFDYRNEKILWAKNNKIPFRSNLKVKDNKLIAADQNNNIYFFDIQNGNILKMIPTEDTKIKNEFKNSFSSNSNYIFMLNTYGSLYAIEKNNNNIRWVQNLNQSLDINPRNLFNANQLINNEDLIIVTSHESTFVIDTLSGTILYKFGIISEVKPLITKQYLFLISSNSLLICINLKNGEKIFSYRLNKRIAEYLEIKEKTAMFRNILIGNSKILILLKNSYLLELDLDGTLKNVSKLPTKSISDLIFIDNSIFYLNNKNKLIILG